MRTSLYLNNYAISVESEEEIELLQDTSNSFSIQNNGTEIKINEDNVFVTRWNKAGLTIPLQDTKINLDTAGFKIKIVSWNIKIEIKPSEDGQLS